MNLNALSSQKNCFFEKGSITKKIISFLNEKEKNTFSICCRVFKIFFRLQKDDPWKEDLNDKNVTEYSNGFYKLSKLSTVRIFSFLNEHDLALFSPCSKTINKFVHAQCRNKWNQEISHWKSIINSKSTIITLEDALDDDNMLNNLFNAETDVSQSYLEISRLTPFEYHKKEQEKVPFISNFKINDRISVIVSNENYTESAYLINNLTREILEVIILPQQSKVINFFGKDLKNPLEFITRNFILQYYPIINQGKTTFELRQKIKIDPDKFQKGQLMNWYSIDSYHLLQAFKVKNLYYFQWNTRGAIGRKVITCLRDIKNPHKHEQLQLNSESCAADDDFFYASSYDSITIYKSGKVWKNFRVTEIELQNVELYPTFHGLVIKAIEYRSYPPLSLNSLTIWNHSKKENEDAMRPFFKLKFRMYHEKDYFKKSKIELPVFVSNDLLFYKASSSFFIYHIPTRNHIAESYDLGRNIKKILTVREHWPKQVIVCCTNLENKYGSNKNEVRVFSIQ